MHVLIRNVGDGNFRPSFHKKQYHSNGHNDEEELERKSVKSHTNIANRWLFMIQRKIMAIILYA